MTNQLKTVFKIKKQFNETINEVDPIKLKDVQLVAKKLLKGTKLDKAIQLKAKKAQDFVKLQASLIQPGFVVELKSGGPAMTVERAVAHGAVAVANQSNRRFMCVYFSGSEFVRLMVPPEALKLVAR